jgi:hypothetical protein
MTVEFVMVATLIKTVQAFVLVTQHLMSVVSVAVMVQMKTLIVMETV